MRRIRLSVFVIMLITILSVLSVGCEAKINTASTPDKDIKVTFDKDHLLPIGSVVLLKEGNKKIMICGRASRIADDENSDLFDYCACYYPEGIINPRELFLFNKEQIEEVFFLGFENDEELELRDFLETKLSEIRR